MRKKDKGFLYKVTGQESDFYPIQGKNYVTFSARQAAQAFVNDHPNTKRVWVWENTHTFEVEASLKEAE